MKLLLTGNLSSVSEDLLTTLSERHSLVLVSDAVPKGTFGRTYPHFSTSISSRRSDDLFRTCDFGGAVFLSSSAAGIRENDNELSELECTLRLCLEHEINYVLYVSSTTVYTGNELADESDLITPIDSIGVEKAACEEMCEYYRKHGLNVITLHVPYIFGTAEQHSLFAGFIDQAINQGAIKFPFGREQTADYISQYDLAVLILRIFDDFATNLPIINVAGSNAITFEQLGQAFIDCIPTLRVSYSGQNDIIAAPLKGFAARSEYDFVAEKHLLDELLPLINAYTHKENSKKTLLQKIRMFADAHKVIIIIAELIFGFILMEGFNKLTGTLYDFHYIDFRLLYVVILAMLHGIKSGFIAATLACVSLLIAFGAQNDWELLIYNVDNWLPFAFYFLVGAVAGYTKNRYTNDNKYLTDEKENLEQRYRYLNELYTEAVKNKGDYRTQILSYKDSYGRIYEIARRLNSILPEVVFKEALSACEDILQNNAISIYTLNKTTEYARLAVCSRSLQQTAPKSIRLSDYSRMIKGLTPNEVWSNMEQVKAFPDYCAPIFDDGRLVVLVMIEKVRFEQMTTYYRNLINILCGLFQISLLRAYSYNEQMEKDLYLGNSRITKKDRFKQLIEALSGMKTDDISDYLLLRIYTTPSSMFDIADKVSTLTRDSDYIGIGQDDKLYLVLSQATLRGMEVIGRRFEQAGIMYEIVESIGDVDESK